jgi:hypothetical protein
MNGRVDGHSGEVRAPLSTVRELRETAVYYRNGPAAARVAAVYGGFVVVVAVLVLADLALGGPHTVRTIALFLAALPGSAAVVFFVAASPVLPGTSGVLAAAFLLVEICLLAGAGLAQSWVLWRLGRGPRLR